MIYVPICVEFMVMFPIDLLHVIPLITCTVDTENTYADALHIDSYGE